MRVEISLDKPLPRLGVVVAGIVFCSGLVVLIFYQFVIGTLADERLEVTTDMLEVPVASFPNSARLNARFAEAEIVGGKRDLARAEVHARRAINSSPHDYRPWLTLASVKEASGDRQAAEEALRRALELAPNHGGVHWRLANVLVRSGKVDESLTHFKTALAYRRDLLGGILDLLWRASGGDVGRVTAVAGDDANTKLKLARFLLAQRRIDEAVALLGSVDRETQLASSESTAFLNALIEAREYSLARRLWSSIVGADSREEFIWNGGFESDILKSFSQYDWTISASEHARLSIDGAVAHSGARSLRITFAGRDTTDFDAIKQLVVLRPGRSYLLECYVKTSDLVTSEGPKLALSGAASNALIAESSPVSPGSADWKLLSVEFVAPQIGARSESAVFLAIKRKPKYSYDEPTSGSVWFDDFALKAVGHSP